MGQTGLERDRHSKVIPNHLSTNNTDYDNEEAELLRCVDAYKRVNSVPWIPYSEVLWILKQLGYRKVDASKVKL